jgi:two-component system sensor histidine kinase RegB
MQLVVEELQKRKADKNQLRVLKEQIKRCKNALSILSTSVGSAPLENGEPMLTQNFVHGLLDDWKLSRPEVNIRTSWKGDAPGPKIIAERSLIQAIKNILDNAANASPDHVFCDVIFANEELTLLISDRGPGLHVNDSALIGKQPIAQTDGEEAKGLGLGLFLSHGIINRFGGKVSLKNISHGGLQTTISLPLQSLAIT